MFAFFSSTIQLTVLAVLIAYVVAKAIYNLFFSPLAAIPGPWYAAVSDLWLTTHTLRLQQCKIIQSLFETYGPVVRVGPNKIVFNDVTTTRSVYSIQKFDKSTYYKSLLTNENDHAMTTLEHSPHAIRRKAYSPHYIPANLTKFQPEIHEPVLELIKTLEHIDHQEPLDCMSLFRQLMVDVLVSTAYGYRLGAVSKWAMGTEDPLSTAIADFPKRGIARSSVPAWVWNLVCRIPNARWRQLCDSDKIMAEFVSERVYQHRAQMKAAKSEEPEKTPMLHRLMDYRLPSGELMPDNDVISECMGHLVAASDTTSVSLTYFLWEVSRRPDIAKRLQMELDDAMPDAHVIPDISVLQNLPYLNAFIKEGLRIYTAAPSLLERVVPAATAKMGDGFDLMGFSVPAGTIVGTQAWSMQRNPDVFPSPETFLPDRWLSADSQTLETMHQHMMPFGTGSRVCGGQNLAQMALKIVVASMLRNFDISAAVETTERSMDVKDSFIIFPAAMECKIHFHPRNL